MKFFRLRKFSRTISGEELVDWLLAHEVATTRDQACGIGQALLDAELIKNITDFKVGRAKVLINNNLFFRQFFVYLLLCSCFLSM